MNTSRRTLLLRRLALFSLLAAFFTLASPASFAGLQPTFLTCVEGTLPKMPPTCMGTWTIRHASGARIESLIGYVEQTQVPARGRPG